MDILRSLRLWAPLALRSIRRHRRKSLATGGFILTGTATLVLIHAMTVGISDTMVLNTTSLHYGEAFAELEPGGPGPEKTASEIEKRGLAETALPRYRFVSLLRRGNSFAPSVSFAVDPVKEAARTAVSRRITRGRYPSGREVLLGEKTSKSLNADVGDSVSIIEGRRGLLGDFEVSGIFSTGIDYFDGGVSYMPAGALEKKFLGEQIAEVSLFFKEGVDRDKALSHLRDQPFRAWDELMPDLVQLIRLNDVSSKIIMSLVFLLVGFGISITFVLATVERFREFGILKAMGVTPRELVSLIFLESFLLCLAAALLGLGAGWLVSSAAGQHGIDLGSLTSQNRYFVVSGVVRPRVTPAGLYLPFVISLAVSTASSYLPARFAASRITVKTLRFQ